jgi:hypothetical protein
MADNGGLRETWKKVKQTLSLEDTVAPEDKWLGSGEADEARKKILRRKKKQQEELDEMDKQ